MFQKVRKFSELGDSGNVEKGAVRKFHISSDDTSVLKHFVSDEKEGQGEPSSGKSNASQPFCAIRALQKGRFALLEVFPIGKRFSLEYRLKNACFSVPLHK